jgi:hypothetical protein
MPIINVGILRRNKAGVDYRYDNSLGNLVAGLKKLKVLPNVVKVYKNLTIVTGIHHTSPN